MKTKRGKCVKKNKQIADVEPDELLRAPHSFVINRGLPELHVRELTKDFRRVMEPFTASSLKVQYFFFKFYLHISPFTYTMFF